MSGRLQIISEIAREGGWMALAMRGALKVSVKPDGSFVTNADIAVQEYIVGKLNSAFPGTALVAEENNENQPGTSDSFFAVDPIDGTDCYKRGFPHFGVSIGLIENGRCTLGVFYNPALEELYAVDSGEPPTLNGEALTLKNISTGGGPLLVPSDFHRYFTTGFQGKIRCYGSTVHHLCYVASGCACAALGYASYIWDYAAGVALVEAAGGKVAMFSGDPFEPCAWRDGRVIQDAVLVAPPDDWDQMKNSFALL